MCSVLGRFKNQFKLKPGGRYRNTQKLIKSVANLRINNNNYDNNNNNKLNNNNNS